MLARSEGYHNYGVWVKGTPVVGSIDSSLPAVLDQGRIIFMFAPHSHTPKIRTPGSNPRPQHRHHHSIRQTFNHYANHSLRLYIIHHFPTKCCYVRTTAIGSFCVQEDERFPIRFVALKKCYPRLSSCQCINCGKGRDCQLRLLMAYNRRLVHQVYTTTL